MKDTSVIPEGLYCYTVVGRGKNGVIKTKLCPYWATNDKYPEQMNGYCSYLEVGDWEFAGLLWDQVKECDVNFGYDEGL